MRAKIYYLVPVVETNLCKSYTKKACSCYYSVTEKPIRKEQANENKINESTILRLLWKIKAKSCERIQSKIQIDITTVGR